MALEMRAACERCGAALATDSAAAICTYECTFCAACVETVLNRRCPNCGGNFAPRPIRPPAALVRDPASTRRVVRDDPRCAALR